jgi:AcrR family transcriptional regulator
VPEPAPRLIKAADDTPPARRRLTAEARKDSILAAARQAFSETGDVNGTTIKRIAEHSGISEGVIYRHFESKDQLFYEAVVEPLKQAIDNLVEAAAHVDQDQPLTPDRQRETATGLYKQLTATMGQVLPLLGLVLFGDPKIAHRFYQDNLSTAMDRLAGAWADVEHRRGVSFDSADIAARAVMGLSLIMALESAYGKNFGRDRLLDLITDGTIHGFFPSANPATERS